jgi:hypothetical protein
MWQRHEGPRRRWLMAAEDARSEELANRARDAGEKQHSKKAGGSLEPCDRLTEPDSLRPGEERNSSPGHELPGATLPWALSRILHVRPSGSGPKIHAPRVRAE